MRVLVRGNKVIGMDGSQRWETVNRNFIIISVHKDLDSSKEIMQKSIGLTHYMKKSSKILNFWTDMI